MIRLHCRIMYVHSTRIVVEQHIEEKPFEKALSKQKFVFFSVNCIFSEPTTKLKNFYLEIIEWERCPLKKNKWIYPGNNYGYTLSDLGYEFFNYLY